jgi:hypothetical protein
MLNPGSVTPELIVRLFPGGLAEASYNILWLIRLIPTVKR